MLHHYTPEEELKFWLLVGEEQPNGCWLWAGKLGTNGYGMHHSSWWGRGQGGARVSAYKMAYEIVNGPVPSHLELDHLCYNRPCCNPAHLEAVPRSVNIKRGYDSRGHKLFCKQGHPLFGDNLYLLILKSGPHEGRQMRACRICKSASTLESTRRMRAKRRATCT